MSKIVLCEPHRPAGAKRRGQVHSDEAAGGRPAPHIRLHSGGRTALLKTERQLKAQLGYLPQDFGLFNELTVAQFLDYMAALKGLRDSGTAVREVIRTVKSGGAARRIQNGLDTIDKNENLNEFLGNVITTKKTV